MSEAESTQVTLPGSEIVVENEELDLGIEAIRSVAAMESEKDHARTAIRLTELADKLEIGMGGEGIIIKE